MDSDRKNVFSYFNGAETIYADPLAIYRRLAHALGGNPNEVVQRSELGITGPREAYPDDQAYEEALAAEVASEPMRFEAMEQLLEAIRVVFRMEPFVPATGKGATEKDCRDAFEAFIAYLEDQKKSAVS